MFEIDEKKKSKVNTELDVIVKKNNGTITPELIVNEANKKGTALHEIFEKQGLFDTQKAIRYAQLNFARIIIQHYRVWVSVENKEPVNIRALVSLTNDRAEGNGYRPIASVMSDDEKREILLSDAKQEMNIFKKKYSILSELAPVFAVIEQFEA